jgi:hypothetical protein
MKMRESLANLQGMVGKTVEAVDDKSCNVVKISFTDGTDVMLEAENVYPSIGLIGIVGYSDTIQAEEKIPQETA